MKYSEISTLEELREYYRANAKRWYEKNKEKKKAYENAKYHKRIAELKAKEQTDQK